MNQPPDWGELARDIADNDRDGPTLHALVITNSRMVITDVILPAFLKAVPGLVSSRARQQVTFARGSTVRFRAVASYYDEECLRGMQFDLVFFDPVWRGDPEQMERIRLSCRRTADASR